MRRHQWLLTALAGTLIPPPPPRLTPLRRALSTAAASGGVAVKKVTRSNFEPTLEDLRALVRESDFVAFDLEMSGVTSAPWRETFEFDDCEVQYLKVKDSAEKFAVVQCGVCPFRWDSSKGSFIAHPHNFYIFPRKELPVEGPSYDFLCQTTSIDFLARHQFDFNACIHDGISYLSRAQEAEVLRSFSSAYDWKSSNSINLKGSTEIPFINTSDIFFVERMKNKFHEWRDGIIKGCPVGENLKTCRHPFQTIFFKMRPAILLDGFSSHQNKLIQLIVKKHFQDLVYVCTNNEDLLEQRVVVYSVSDDDKAMLMKEVQEDLWAMTKAKIRSAVGFRHVIDLLASEQKLIVGHSCILDIAHIYHKFFGPLPSKITEFASSLHKHFPYVIDTKHLLKGNDVFHRIMDKKCKSLSSVFTLLCPEVSFSMNNCISPYRQQVKVEVPAEEIGSSWNSGVKHEAGYDAFMTGCVFAQTCSYLGIDFKLLEQPLELSKNEKLQKHINLVYPNWKSDNVIDLKTGIEVPEFGAQANKRRYPKIDFDNIVLLWGFPPKIKPTELRGCISEVYGLDSITSIFYLDETAAFIQFSKPDLVRKFLALKDSLERNNNIISVLHPFSTLLEGGNARAASYATYKEICSSSASNILFAEQADAIGFNWRTKLEDGGVEVDIRESENAGESINPKPTSVDEISTRKENDYAGIAGHLSCEAILESSSAFKLPQM